MCIPQSPLLSSPERSGPENPGLEPGDTTPEASESESDLLPGTPEHSSPEAASAGQVASPGQTLENAAPGEADSHADAPPPAGTVSPSRKRPRDLEFDENKVYWLETLLEALEFLDTAGSYALNYDGFRSYNSRYLDVRNEGTGIFWYGREDDYRFTFYAPREMKRLRTACKISEHDVWNSLVTLDNSCEKFFGQWVTRDDRLLIKTTTCYEEMQAFLRHLKDYCDCICDSAGASLLPKIYFAGDFEHHHAGSPFYFFIMENTLAAKQVLSSTSIPMSPLDYIWFHGNLARDTLFLQKHNLMDYALYRYDDNRNKGLFLGNVFERRSTKECMRVLRRQRDWRSLTRLFCCFWPSICRKRARAEADVVVIDSKYQSAGQPKR